MLLIKKTPNKEIKQPTATVTVFTLTLMTLFTSATVMAPGAEDHFNND